MCTMLTVLLATAVLSNIIWGITYLYSKNRWRRKQFLLRIKLYSIMEYLLDCAYPDDKAMMEIINAFHRERSGDTTFKCLCRALEIRRADVPGTRTEMPELEVEFLKKAFPDEELMLETLRAFEMKNDEEEIRQRLNHILSLGLSPEQKSIGERIAKVSRFCHYKFYLYRYYYAEYGLLRLLSYLTGLEEWKGEKVVSGECLSCGEVFSYFAEEWEQGVDMCPGFSCHGEVKIEFDVPKGRKVKQPYNYSYDSTREYYQLRKRLLRGQLSVRIQRREPLCPR